MPVGAHTFIARADVSLNALRRSRTEARESVTQDTFVGHVWRFRRGPGGPVVTQWTVDRSSGTVAIGDGGATVYVD